RNYPLPTSIGPLSLHDALPISAECGCSAAGRCRMVLQGDPARKRFAKSRADTLRPIAIASRHPGPGPGPGPGPASGKDQAVIIRSEEHTSELQSRENLVCRLLL